MNKIIDVTEVAELYCVLDLLLAEMEPNGACKVMDGVVIFKNKAFLKDKAMRMMSKDAQEIMEALRPVEYWLEVAKKYHISALNGLKNFGEHYAVITAYSVLYEYAKNPKYKLFTIHKNRIHKVLSYLRKEAKTGDGKQLRYLDSIFINSTKFGELLYKKIRGEM